MRHKLYITCYKLHRRSFSQSSIHLSKSIDKIRNIGILAHIDAGKTTTTERMLYYSGVIDHMGEVHHGNTVTDYLEQERKRGITITSASVTFDWKSYKFNLIDTPGHIDFTMGVEQSICVLDGAVVVLDGSAGVEPQTMTVWRQADRYNIPRIVYVNKMDKSDADFDMSVKSLSTKLEVETLPIQFPIKNKTELNGIVDIISLEKWMFRQKDNSKFIQKVKLNETEDDELLLIAQEKRQNLTDKLSGMDDELANVIIEQNSIENIPAQLLMDSLRRVTISRKGIPVLLGSSYKNIGLQSLMDAVILYLPHPQQSALNIKYNCFGDNLAAKVFKIVHDKQRGPLAFVRMYNGSLKRKNKLYNIQRDVNEVCAQLYSVRADEYEEISQVDKGSIAAISGFKKTVTGDLITSSAATASNAKHVMIKKCNVTEDEADKFFMLGAHVPNPVFFCSIEPPSLAYQNALDNALKELELEDPSLRVKVDENTGQTVLGGMGELHMDIIKDRIKTEYKIDADLGELQIAYKETITIPIKDIYEVEHKIGESRHRVKIILSLVPEHQGSSAEKPVLLLDNSQDCTINLRDIKQVTMNAIKRGIISAFTNGPKLGCPIINVAVKLHWLETGKNTSSTIVSSSVTQCIKKMFKQCEPIILEPIMSLEVVVLKKHKSTVMADLDKRRADITDIDIRGQNEIVRAFVPLSELLGYATSLRISTSGNATFTMEFSHYRTMHPFDEREAIRKITGF